ncbi:MAG: glycosyltransferase [Candidatus Omnitrophota bacterium]
MKALIVYAKAGAGHLRAAEAVFGALKRKGKEKDVTIIDCLDYTTPFFKAYYPQIYLLMVRFAPWLWAFLYFVLDNRLVYFFTRPIRRRNNNLASQRFVQFLKKENPPVIVSTQFFASEVAGALKVRGQISSQIISVVTDFGAHTFWEAEGIDIFTVGSEDTKKDLLGRGIPEEKIKVLGIPIDPITVKGTKQEVRKELGLRADAFVVLIVGGGFGVGPIHKLVTSLNRLDPATRAKVQVLVVCSRNEKLHQKMSAIAPQLKIEAKMYGFVADLYQMMVASDIIVSKSGGLTTSESLACGLPMIIISPIPGQETKNCAHLVKHGAALRIDRPGEVKAVIKQLVENPQTIERMRQQTRVLARPRSADDITALAEQYMN